MGGRQGDARARSAQELGIENIEGRSGRLAGELARRLAAVPVAEPITPFDPATSAGLAQPDLGKWPWNEHRIIVAASPEDRKLRISLGHYVQKEEVVRLASLLASLSTVPQAERPTWQ